MLRSKESGRWEDEYWKNENELYRDLGAEEDYDLCFGMGRYEIIFKHEGMTRYCFIDASSMDEALGNFFRHHPDVSYDEIVEHMEI